MPLYEYECDACGRRFERIQKFSDPLVSVCPTCGGLVRKLFSSPAIQFKGSGFYNTDYAKSGKAPEGEGSGKPAAAGADGGKSEKGDKAEKVDKGESSGASAKSDTSTSEGKPATEGKKSGDAPAKGGTKSESS